MSAKGERATLSVREAAQMLGIARNSAYQGILLGQIPHIKIGRRILVPKAALMKLLEGRDVPHAANGSSTSKPMDHE